MRKNAKYSKDLPRRMYSYFLSYSEPGIPSFAKFARSIGVTAEELRSFREKKKFDAAWRECNEIRRDYLIDTALCKRVDASFAKFLYSPEFPEEDGSRGEGDVNVTLEVLER